MSDLDNEELIATRKLNGLDDNLFKESDKNVGSIENDMNEIEEIKDLLRFLKQHGWIPNINKTINVDTTIKAINNLLIDYERQKQINEEHQKINGELRTQIKFLEIKLEFKQWGDLDNLDFEEYMNQFIPKEKIIILKEKIHNVLDRNGITRTYQIAIDEQFEKLLKESEDKK